MVKFRDLQIGDTFDFISPNAMLNSYHLRCKKLSARTYTPVDAPHALRVGSINVEVYHIERSARSQQGE